MNQLNIRKLRKKANLSQKVLGDKLGLTQAQISSWENGKVKLNKVKLCGLKYFFESLGILDET